jgi:hypothetical protein
MSARPAAGRWLLRLFPAQWRKRYGDEVADLLGGSRRPIRDRLDLLRVLPGEHVLALSERRDLVRWLPLLAAACIALGLTGAILVIPDLQDGWVEIPGHWWSTLAVVPALVGVGLAVIAVGARRSGDGPASR